MSDDLDGNGVHLIIGAYNDMLPVTDPATNETVHLIGFESWIYGGMGFPNYKGDVHGNRVFG